MSTTDQNLHWSNIFYASPSKELESTIAISQALAIASAAGIRTIEFTKCSVSADLKSLSRAVLLARLQEVIEEDQIWNRIAVEQRRTMAQMAPVALVHFGDGVLPDANLIFPVECSPRSSAPAVLSEALVDLLYDRLGILKDVEPSGVLEMAIKPGHSTWLSLGATLHFARFKESDLPDLSGVKIAASGGLELCDSEVARELAQDLVRLWPCSFDAVFVEFEETLRLADVSISARSAQENALRLAKNIGSLGAPSKDSNLLLANAAVRLPTQHKPTSLPIWRGQSQGDRYASGPLVTSMDEVSRFAAEGQRPILVMNSLSPAAAHGLEQCGGLVLEREGPASHIAILARSLGLAVVTRVEGLRLDNDASVSRGGQHLRPGELISVNEDDGGIYRGAILPSVSPIMSIATWIDQQGKNPVTIAANANSPQLPTGCIGLCRSEMQVLGSSVSHQFKEYLKRVIASVEVEPIPTEVKTYMHDCLAKLLASSKGQITNYRLMDADISEVLVGDSQSKCAQYDDIKLLPRIDRTVRGPRWALASGFYDWQLGMAISTAAAASRNGQIDLIVTLPSAFSLEEVRAVRVMFDQHILEHPAARSSVRFGVMLETPRLCSAPTPLATIADAISFGLNDLTSAAYGLTREAWSAFEKYYRAAGLAEHDPFASLDRVSVGALVKAAMKKLSNTGFKGPFFLCGEPAASTAAHHQFAGEQDVYFSVGESDWARSSMSCGKVIAGRKGSVLLGRSSIEKWSTSALNQVIAARGIGRNACAQEAALRWFESVVPLEPTPHSHNWKFLKKLLVSSLFGELEGRFFLAPWTIEEVANFVQSLNYPNRQTRVSEFPNTISCHSRSELIDRNWSQKELREFLSSFDNNATLNVFPQQNPDQMCFRAVFNEAGIILEVGWGQAMYVFETERGQHPIITSKASSANGLAALGTGAPEKLSSAAFTFLECHRRWLQAMYDVLPTILGAQQLAIEGYFDPVLQRRVIVDIDVPLDIAWNTPSQNSLTHGAYDNA